MRVSRVLAAAAVAVAACSHPSPEGGDAAVDDAAVATDAAATDAITPDAQTDAAVAPDARTDADPPGVVGQIIPLLDLGHVGYATVTGLSPTRAVTFDQRGHWNLWDRSTRTRVASGDAPGCPGGNDCTQRTGQLGGAVFIVWTSTVLEVRDTATGALVQMIPVDLRVGGVWTGTCGVAVDGSYVYAAAHDALRVWRPDGQLLLERLGNHELRSVFAAPGELRIARLGFTVPVQTVSVPGGVVTNTAFTAPFHRWSLDGEHFTTLEVLGMFPTTDRVRIYTRTGTLVSQRDSNDQLVAVQGAYASFRSFDELQLRIHAITDLAAPPVTVPLTSTTLIDAQGSSLVIGDGVGLEVIRLGATIDQGPLMVGGIYRFGSGAADASGWAATSGTLVHVGVDEVGGPLNVGHVQSAATAAGGGVAVVPTGSGVVYVVQDAAMPAITGTINASLLRAELTADGAVAIARSLHEPYALHAFDTASGATLRTWQYGAPGGYRLLDFSVMPATGRTSHVLGRSSPFEVRRRLIDLDGTEVADFGPLVIQTTIYGSLWSRPLFSRSGRNAAFLRTDSSNHVGAQTQLYRDGVLTADVAGVPLGWIDDDRVLMWVRVSLDTQYNVIHRFDGSVASSLPALSFAHPVVAAGQEHLFVPLENQVRDVTTGALIWQGPPGEYGGGTVLGDFVLHVRGTRLVAERFRP